MAYTKYAYTRINWKNKSESLETPLGKTNLNRMDSAIYQIAENLDIAYNEMATGKFDEANAGKVIVGMPTWDADTGILTFQFYDGTEFLVDFNIEKIPVSFSMDSSGLITMTTSDGTQWTADIGDVIPDYTFHDSGRIAFSRTKNEDGSYTVTADIIKGSITGDYLEPDYLANVTTHASIAAASANSAGESADNASYDAKLAQSYAIGGSGIRDGEDADNSKYYKEQTQQYAEIAANNAENASASADNAKESETNAANSEINAGKAAENAVNSAESAEKSASDAGVSAEIASRSASEALASAEESTKKAADASGYAVIAESFTHGSTGTREGEDADNAMFYYEQAKHISQGGNGLVPMGTITFEQIPTEDVKTNAMYNISNDFTSDERFHDGGGIFYGAGNNIYYTVEGKWDVLASSNVTGIKGVKQSTYMQGNVSLSAEDIGSLPDDTPYAGADKQGGSANSAKRLLFEDGNQIYFATEIESELQFANNIMLNLFNPFTKKADATAKITGYYFGNRNGGTDGVTLYADRFYGTAESAYTADEATISDKTRKLIIQNDNEINFGGLTPGEIHFNHRNADSGTTSDNTAITDYYFDNRNGETDGVTLHAETFEGNVVLSNTPSDKVGALWFE